MEAAMGTPQAEWKEAEEFMEVSVCLLFGDGEVGLTLFMLLPRPAEEEEPLDSLWRCTSSLAGRSLLVIASPSKSKILRHVANCLRLPV